MDSLRPVNGYGSWLGCSLFVAGMVTLVLTRDGSDSIVGLLIMVAGCVGGGVILSIGYKHLEAVERYEPAYQAYLKRRNAITSSGDIA